MSSHRKSRLIPWLLVILPAWLFISAGLFLVKHFKDEKAALVEEEKRFARTVSNSLIADDLRKIVTVIGERNTSKPENLRAMASMIQGLLGPSNTGYKIDTIDGPAGFPIIKIGISAIGENAPIWILSSYDSPIGSVGAEKNATGLTASLATAQALANSSPSHPIHFLFLPHVNQTEAPVLETAELAANLIESAGKPKAVLCIEAMGEQEELILSSRDTEALPTYRIDGLGKILGAEVVCLGEDFDLASILFELGLPAARVATRPILLPDEADDKLPFAPTLSSSTGRVIELVKRLAGTSS
jgi:hypothetical protein